MSKHKHTDCMCAFVPSPMLSSADFRVSAASRTWKIYLAPGDIRQGMKVRIDLNCVWLFVEGGVQRTHNDCKTFRITLVHPPTPATR